MACREKMLETRTTSHDTTPSLQPNAADHFCPKVQHRRIHLEERILDVNLTDFKDKYFLIISETGGNFASLVGWNYPGGSLRMKVLWIILKFD